MYSPKTILRPSRAGRTLGAVATLALMLSATSCSEENQSMPSATTRTITATIADRSESRTAIDGTSYSDGRTGIVWTADDRLGVYSNTTRNAAFTNRDGATGGRVAFTGNLAGDAVCAYYPYSEVNDSREADNLQGTLPLLQTWKEESGTVDGDYKYGRPRAGVDDEFDFTHLFALLHFSVNATGTAIEGETLRSVEIELPAGRTLGGDFTFSALDGKYEFTGGDGANRLTVEWENGKAMTSGTVAHAYASCAPDMKTNDPITITVTTDRHTATFKRTVAYDFEADCIYTFDLNLRLYAGDGEGDLTIEELPVEETANCYMINTAGEHSFIGTVIGNGQKGIIPGAGFHTDDARISPVSARLLWEDTAGFITNVRLGSDGRIYYTANTNEGNALIAAEDADGTILWSWHIWGVGDTMPEDYTITTKKGSTFQIMDRNLGAFSSTYEQRMETTRTAENEARVLHCMLYQWGRKDPFPNSDKYYVDGQEVDIASSYPVWQPATTDEATIEAGVRRPGYIINRATGSSDDHWLGSDNQLLWGDDKDGNVKDNGWTNVKTIYDPSPAGYRVANNATFTNFSPYADKPSVKLSGTLSFRTDADGNIIPTLSEQINCVIETFYDGTVPRWTAKGIHKDRIGFAYGSTNNKDKIFGYGLYMQRYTGDTEGNYYTMSGYRFPNSNGSRSSYAKAGYWWMSRGNVSNTSGRGTTMLYHFFWLTGSGNYKEPDKGLGTGGSGLNGQYDVAKSMGPWYAHAVRCVRE